MNVVQRERVIAYTEVKAIVTEALLAERRAFDLRREDLDRRAQNVAAQIVDTIMPEAK